MQGGELWHCPDHSFVGFLIQTVAHHETPGSQGALWGSFQYLSSEVTGKWNHRAPLEDGALELTEPFWLSLSRLPLCAPIIPARSLLLALKHLSLRVPPCCSN